MTGADDSVLPFAVAPLDLRGRLARLGPAIDAILSRHAYPDPVARLLGEAAALTVLLGSVLKSGGRFQLQTRTDGLVDMIVVDFDAPDRLRAFARFDAARLPPRGGVAADALLGRGHLALTIEQGGELTRYQGVAPIDGGSLEAAARLYFQQSEQIPTFIRLAAGQVVTPAGTSWRAGGLLAQFLPHSEERRRQADLPPGDTPEGFQAHEWTEDEAWTEAQAFASTVEDHELLDPDLSSESLAYRLFHERGVHVFPPHPLRDACRCSSERVESMLRSFSQAERDDMIGDDGMIGVTCEFCSTLRRYNPDDFRED
ncbi:Hsp33 family molecular chaperone [Rhodoblastus acidophilus]|uniref:Hsp33 family molecular chaperone n=1 Tax=Candidatus Rhodoblastus alkanivorans TaxID=2954117 RepID=A0ABS9Z5C2_9HYPH|nr:Hsp33 family molecular chaperone [Candidatus Rhodoblastus alkanivorans]MCI4682671.1 Hsp33 family molecular chaperone [Candidatus Rhodoblastus alkanivorans]MDI4639978.1 Hsp33 family molecular chaperone [Rhodoblastus acidophilus]